MPITLAAICLARLVPWNPEHVRTFVGVHLAAGLLASFVLNAGFFAVEALLGGGSAEAAPGAALRAAVRWLHLNAAGYGCVVLAVQVLDGRLSGVRAAGTGAKTAETGTEADSRMEAKTEAGAKTGTEATPQAEAGARALRTRSGSGGVRIPLDEIDWIEADGDYAKVHTEGRSYLVSRRMKGLARELESSSFVRVHRSAIVNAARVRELRHRSHGDYEAVMRDGTVVRVSRTRREGLFRVWEGEGEF